MGLTCSRPLYFYQKNIIGCLFSIIYGMSSFPFTNSYFSTWFSVCLEKTTHVTIPTSKQVSAAPRYKNNAPPLPSSTDVVVFRSKAPKVPPVFWRGGETTWLISTWGETILGYLGLILFIIYPICIVYYSMI